MPAWVLFVVVVLGAAAGCVPAPLVRSTPGGSVLVNGRVRYLVARDVAGESTRLVELDCSPPSPADSTVACVERSVALVEPLPHASPTGAAGDAVAAAAGCPASDIVVQSGDAATGFWLWVCGSQRFFRRSDDGIWHDETP